MKTYTIRLIADRALVYDRFTYPAGETQVRIRPDQLDGIKDSDVVNIVARVHSADDIVELALLCDAIHCLLTGAYIRLILPYLPYSRADRPFVEGDCHGLATFAYLVKSFDVDEVVTLDAHSPAAADLFGDMFVNVEPTGFIEAAIGKFAALHGTDRIVVLFPDKGAHDRYAVPEMVGCNTKVTRVKTLYASKRRNPVTGVFEGFEVPNVEDFEDLPTLIVDDICDGGGTFVGLGKAIPQDIRLGLYVTHGIFSKGLGPLAQFEMVYTTNTFHQTDPRVEVFDAMPTLMRGGA